MAEGSLHVSELPKKFGELVAVYNRYYIFKKVDSSPDPIDVISITSSVESVHWVSNSSDLTIRKYIEISEEQEEQSCTLL